MTDPESPRESKSTPGLQQRAWLVPLAFLLLATLVYWPCMDGPPHLDDKHVIPDLDESSPWAILGQYRRIFTHLTFALNAAAHGEMMLGYHLVNVVVHALAALGLSLLVRELTEKDVEGRIAVAVGTLFLLHPLASQAVSYVSQRYTSLAGALFIWSLVAYVRSRRAARDEVWLVVAAGLGLLAVFSKEYVIGLPVIALAIEWLWPQPHSKRWARPAIYALPLLLFLAAYWRDVVPPAPKIDNSGGPALVSKPLDWALGQVPRSTYALTQVKIVSTNYLRRMVWPTGQSVDHDFTPSHKLDLAVSASALFLVALGVLGWWCRKREPLITLGVAIAAITLAPTSSIMPNTEFVAEHRAYLALAGICLIAAVLLNRLPTPQHYFALGGICLILGTLTFRRATVWGDQALLWQDASKKTEWIPRPPYALGTVYQARGDFDAAEAAYKQSLDRASEYAPALYNLSLLYELQERYRDAFDVNAALLMKSPNRPEFIDNAIRLSFKLNDLERAAFSIDQGLKIQPKRPSFRLAAARLAFIRGDHAQAEKLCRELLADGLSDFDQATVRLLLEQIARTGEQ